MKTNEIDEVQAELFIYWIKERDNIRTCKEMGLPKPWTKDDIFLDYKFCNVKREDDKVTRWLHSNWLQPYAAHPNIAPALCLARLFNWPETLETIGFPETWDPEYVRRTLKQRRAEKNKIFTGAYLVSTCGRPMDKIDYAIDIVLTPVFDRLRGPKKGDSLESYWLELTTYQGFASFMAGQVVADLKFIDPLRDAYDWETWAPLGPGSIRGLNRMFGRNVSAIIKQAQGLKEMREIQSLIYKKLGMRLALHNVQNCHCEFDKYMRLKNGGQVRSSYPGRG